MIGSLSIPDINVALPRALPELLAHGRRVTAASVANQRPTIEYPGVFITEYTNPQRNVLFDPVRDANPFFHYLEAMWIIAGQNDVKFLAHILPKMADYSDDGRVFHGAYGYRLRYGFGIDQIAQAIRILDHAPTSRQVVMSIWDPQIDLGAKTKDMPCNDMIMCKVREGRLNITVNNRSNDAVLGCYGANVVQFSMLQMYMAAKLGVSVGVYTQVSDSFHVYEDNPYWLYFLDKWHSDRDSYLKAMEAGCDMYRQIGTNNLFQDGIECVDAELRAFFDDAQVCMDDPELSMLPMKYDSSAVHDAACIWNALHYGRDRDYENAHNEISLIRASDWGVACGLWMKRRQDKFERDNHAV